MLTVDSASLSFNVEEAQRLRDNIIASVVGQGSSIINSEALNERQVDANFESRSTVLNRIKKGFEAAQQFVDETVCRLRYGSSFLSARVNLGTEFYTMTPSDLRQRYTAAKNNGASEAELDAMHRQIVETEYRHNPTELQRLLILGDLEPYQHMTRDEVIDLYSRPYRSGRPADKAALRRLCAPLRAREHERYRVRRTSAIRQENINY